MNWPEIILCFVLMLSSLGVIIAHKPVYSGLSFLITLITLSGLYLQLSAEFTAAMQIIVYAGAILVIFMFVIILFQDAYLKLDDNESQSPALLIGLSAVSLIAVGLFFGAHLVALPATKGALIEGFGTVESLGHALFVDYFFPFEAVVFIFLIATTGAVYIGSKRSV